MTLLNFVESELKYSTSLNNFSLSLEDWEVKVKKKKDLTVSSTKLKYRLKGYIF